MPPLNATSPQEPIDLQETLSHYASAIRTINTSLLIRLVIRARAAAVGAALDTIPGLCQEIQRLRAMLARVNLDHANLVAAARSTLVADHDGEPDPLWYLRDELAERGQFPRVDGGTQGAS